MTLRELDGQPGPPWGRELAGELDSLVVESELLAGNPLGDPARRPLYVYRPPGVPSDDLRTLPSVVVIQGFTGQLDMWLSRTAREPTMAERLDAMFVAGDCPDAIVVFVDAWTSRGGSQFLNSAATGRYMDYLCDEVVPFVDARYPAAPGREHRGLAGKSSGGYGAMVVPMLRPDVFGALASHAGDALFECCYQREFPVVARELRDHFEGSYHVFHERLAAAERFDWGRFGKPFELYGYASAYSPDSAHPGKVLLPVRDLDGTPRRGHLGAVVGARPRADGSGARGGAAQHAAHLPGRWARRRVLPGPRGAGVLGRARQARRGALAGAVRRKARRDRVPLPGRDPGAGGLAERVRG